MAQPAEFEELLKEVVNAKRLSASKMDKLTELAMKCMENDTQIVTTLYRTHKTLPQSSKVSSLYVFDALARGARRQVTRLNLVADLKSPKGNCATFLLRLEGVLDSVFRDMISSGTDSGKEKARKILDIWSKNQTFPTPVLARLGTQLTGNTTDQASGNANASKSSTDPRGATTTPPVAPPTSSSPPAPSVVATPAADPQSALMALLSRAVSAAGSQVQPPPATSPPLLSANPEQTSGVPASAPVIPLALLQQLAQAQALQGAHNGANVAAPLQSNQTTTGHLSNSRSPPSVPFGGPYRQKTPTNDATQWHREDRYGSSRGSSRGGGYRGRGRGGSHDSYNRERSFRDPRSRDGIHSPRNHDRSRSRSPNSRTNDAVGKRGTRPYSPPRRTALSAGQSGGVVKDEFGRDIRKEDEPQVDASTNTATVVQQQQDVEKADYVSSPVSAAINQTAYSEPIQSTSSSVTPNVVAAPSMNGDDTAAFAQHAAVGDGGLETFNVATFDFSSPPAWEALGKMWERSYGVVPTTEALMQFVMACSTGMMQPQQMIAPTVAPQAQALGHSQQQYHGQSGQAWSQGYEQPAAGRGRGRGGFRGRGRGRGGGSYDQYNSGYNQWDNGSGSNTEAIVLGGGNVGPDFDDDQNPFENEGVTVVANSGRMQKVDGKWKFVKS